MLQTYTTETSYQRDSALKSTQAFATGVGLSYSPYLTENRFVRLYFKRYRTGELVVSTHDVYAPNRAETRQKPPINKGERVVEGLSRRGRSRIRRSANYYDTIQGDNGPKTMITLTYGSISKSGHKESKADLDRFIKSLTRYVKSEYKTEAVHWAWVAEIQPKRLKRTGEAVIHYHLMTIYHIPKDLISKWWNNAVNKPRIKANLPTQKLLPNVISCYHAGAYMAKYLSKEGHKIKGNGYNMSQATSNGIKPTFNACIDVSEEAIEDIYRDIAATAKDQTQYTHTDDQGSPRLMWLSSTNEYLFTEQIKSIDNERHNRTSPKNEPNSWEGNRGHSQQGKDEVQRTKRDDQRMAE